MMSNNTPSTSRPRSYGRAAQQGISSSTLASMLESIPENDDDDQINNDTNHSNENNKNSNNSNNGCSPKTVVTVMNIFDLPPCIPSRRKKKTHTSHDQLNLVNEERSKRGLIPYRPSLLLDLMALEHAHIMAKSGKVFHSVTCIEELMIQLSSKTVAENIQRGYNLVSMHEHTMEEKDSVNCTNIISNYFEEFGAAIVKGNDGKLYSCQLFRK